MKVQKSKKGNARARRDRIRTKCARYRKESRRERNKARRLVRHILRQPSDAAARRCLGRLYDEVPLALREVREFVLRECPSGDA